MGKETKKIEDAKKQDPDTRPAADTGDKGKTIAVKSAESVLTGKPTANSGDGFKSVPKRDSGLVDIDDLAKEQGLPEWEKAAFFRAAGWAPGKKVASALFGLALAKFRNRQLGGGKI